MSTPKPKTVKVIFCGPPETGKTVCRLAIMDELSSSTSYVATIGMDFSIKREDQLSYHIWETAGDPRFRTTADNYLKDKSLVFVFCDATLPQEKWLSAPDEDRFLPETIHTLAGKKVTTVLVGAIKKGATAAPSLTPEALTAFATAKGFDAAAIINLDNPASMKAAFQLGIQTLAAKTTPRAAAASKKATAPKVATFPASYAALYREGGLRTLLQDYVDKGVGFSAFWHSHWRRHHATTVANALAPSSDSLAPQKTDDQLYRELCGLLKNPHGSLARRLDYYRTQSSHSLDVTADGKAAPCSGTGGGGAAAPALSRA